MHESRVFTDEVGEETFVFHAGLLSWKTFVGELQGFAEHYGLGFEYSLVRGPLWGVLGIEVTCRVTGPFSAVTNFAEYARCGSPPGATGTSPADRGAVATLR